MGHHFSDSHHLSLLIKNMAKGPLLVAIVAPDFVRLDETKIQLEVKENRKVSVKNTKELFDHKICFFIFIFFYDFLIEASIFIL